MPSHAVWSLWRYPVCRNTRAANRAPASCSLQERLQPSITRLAVTPNGTPPARRHMCEIAGERGARASGNCACKNDALPKQRAAIKQAIAGDRFQRRRRASIVATLADSHDPLSLSGVGVLRTDLFRHLNGTPQSYVTLVQSRSQSGLPKGPLNEQEHHPQPMTLR
jgi:hypothetical protein